jgi:hypothetical protein
MSEVETRLPLPLLWLLMYIAEHEPAGKRRPGKSDALVEEFALPRT